MQIRRSKLGKAPQGNPSLHPLVSLFTMEALEPKTTIGSETQTLAMPQNPELGLGLEEFSFEVGDFVWGTFEGNQWWPGRIRDPLEYKASNPDQSSKLVAYFGVKSSSWCNPSQLKPFVSKFDKFASLNSSKSFKAALDLAVREFSKCLEVQLSSHCVPKEERLGFGPIGCDFSHQEFLDLVKDVALDVKIVNVLKVGMLRSWIVAYEKGLGVGHCRKTVWELVDKLDLDVAETENSSTNCNRGQKKNKKNVVSRNAHMSFDLEVGSNSVGVVVKEEEVGSGRRERKKSKYLSPPYTYLSGEFAKSLSAEVVKYNTLGLAKEEEEEEISSALVQIDKFDIGELVSELAAMAVNSLHLKGNPLGKVVRGFFAEYRRSFFCMSGKVYGENKTMNEEVDDTWEEGKKTEGKVGRKWKDVVNVEGEALIVKSEEGKKTKVKRARKKKVVVNGEGLTPRDKSEKGKQTEAGEKVPIGKSEEVMIAEGEGKSLIDKSEEVAKIEGEGEAPIDKSEEGTIFEDEEKKATGKSDEGKKTEVKRGRKRKAGLNNNTSKTNPEDPAALHLTFSPGIAVPSREELISACSKYGLIIEPETELLKELSSAKVVFARSSDAEKAFNDKVAAIGPHVVGYRLSYLMGGISSPPSQTLVPVPKPPLPYIKKSLEQMISSIGGVGLKPEMSASLVGEMQGLLTKVDKLLTGPAAGTSA